jgi:hypothetical protein
MLMMGVVTDDADETGKWITESPTVSMIIKFRVTNDQFDQKLKATKCPEYTQNIWKRQVLTMLLSVTQNTQYPSCIIKQHHKNQPQ